MIDPSGYNWLSSAWHSIKHFFSKWGRMIAAVVSFGYLALLASAWLASVSLLQGTITFASGLLAATVSSALAEAIE
jgi:hypothetical protein